MELEILGELTPEEVKKVQDYFINERIMIKVKSPAPKPPKYVPLGELEYLEIHKNYPCLYIKTGYKNGGDGVARSWSPDLLHEHHFRRLHHEHSHLDPSMFICRQIAEYFTRPPKPNTLIIKRDCSIGEKAIQVVASFDAGPKE